MAILSKTVKNKWNRSTKKMYEEKGYVFTAYGDEFEVLVEHLATGSHLEIDILCDYCKKKKYKVIYKTYARRLKERIIQKDCCPECVNKKKKEAGQLKKTDFNKVKEKFTERNCILLTTENEYESNKTKLKYICIKHKDEGVKTVTWGHYQNATFGCRSCSDEGMVDIIANRYSEDSEERIFPYKFNIDIAKKDFEKKGLALIEEVYINDRTPMRYTCKKHEEFGVQTTILKSVRGRVKNPCKLCNLESQSGEKSHLWKGGITSENKIIRDSYATSQWRNEVFKRDRYICQACGYDKGKTLRAHHILNFSNHEDLRFDVDNGITLCNDCHNPNKIGSFHHIYGTFNNNKEQLDEFIKNKKLEKQRENVENV